MSVGISGGLEEKGARRLGSRTPVVRWQLETLGPREVACPSSQSPVGADLRLDTPTLPGYTFRFPSTSAPQRGGVETGGQVTSRGS